MQLQLIRKRLPLIIGIACGVWAILLLNSYLSRRESEIWNKIRESQRQSQAARPQGQMAVALIAARDIPPQTPITPADLSMKEIPVEYIQPGAVTSLNEAIGQIASTPIAAGEQLLKTKLLPASEMVSSLSQVTPVGKRAVNVNVSNMENIASLIRPGDYVDVLALIALPDARGVISGERRLISLFQHIKVLAVGGQLASPSEGQMVKREQTKAPGATGGGVTLSLDPQEASLLSFVQANGEIKLVLRSAEDTQEEIIKPADWDTLTKYISPPGSEADTRPVVEIYRGLNKEVVPLSEKTK